MNINEFINNTPLLKSIIEKREKITTLGVESVFAIIPEDLRIEMTEQDIEKLVSIFGRAELKRLQDNEE